MPDIVLDDACPTCAKCWIELNTPKQTARRHALITLVAFCLVASAITVMIAGFTNRPHADVVLGVIGCGFALLGIVAFGNWFGLLMHSVQKMRADSHEATLAASMTSEREATG